MVKESNTLRYLDTVSFKKIKEIIDLAHNVYANICDANKSKCSKRCCFLKTPQLELPNAAQNCPLTDSFSTL